MLRFGYTPKKIQFLAELAFDGEYDTENYKKRHLRPFTGDFSHSSLREAVCRMDQR